MSKPRATQRGRRRVLTLLVAGLLARRASAAEAMVTEVVPIGFRSVDELLPVIRPLVPAPGSVGGIYNQLVIKTTPSNLAEIKQILASLDRAPVNLMVSVRHTINEAVRRDLLEASGTLNRGDVSVSAGGNAASGRGGVVVLGGDNDSQAALRLLQTDRQQDSRDVQSVRVLEGREAFIRSGESVPLAQRRVLVTGGGTLSVQDSVRYEDVDSGFYVVARLSGNFVTVDIAPRRRQRSAAGGGAIDVQSASTVVSGPLGRWMEIGGVSTSSDTHSSGITYSTRSGSSGERGIFLKVERLP